MAGLMVGGAFLGSFLNVLFDKLASPEVVNFIRGKKLDSDLIGRFDDTLIAVTAVLNDAEKKQFRDSAVNNWLNRLKDAVYVADDLLDEISTKAVTQKEEVSNLSSSLFNLQESEMVSKLEDIVKRLESLLNLKKHLDLKEIAVENLSYKTPSTSLQGGSHVYGRDKDKEAIIKLLLDDNINGGEEVSVIPIVGMGGVGKTTLAQLVYNDDSLENFFNLKAWVCVSEEFDILRVTKIITQAVTGSTCEMDDLNLLQIGLQGRLKEKKFLIVLDDVWIEDYVNWDLLKKPFQRGVMGSKILVTTRNRKVASVVQTVQTNYNINQLSNEDCWLVFANHACFPLESSGNTAALEKIGREIVKKCAGLPLAAQSLGGILRRKHDIRDWENLLNSDIWELSESESKIIPALRVSYHYLPPHLKRCFVYCSLYPKDFEFEKDDLILLWMAEDLLPPPRKGKTLEEVGCEYFDYLVAKSFLQRSRYSWKKSFVMHDLLHDLATFLGGEFYFRSEGPVVETKISIKTRHLSFTKFSGLLENFEVLGTAKFLRTFLPMTYEYDYFEFDGNAARLLKLKHLRVLSFCRFRCLNALLDSIGELIHLRYLDLSETSIVALPESLSNLYNLQTLKLYDCHKLTMLPSSMQNLVNLLHLDITLTALKEMPKGMGKLTQLQHFSDYIVGKHEENGIKELGGLSNLHGSLQIAKLENVSNGNEASEAKMVDKKYINKLILVWYDGNNCFDSQTEIDILCKLQPHQDLQCLEICCYRGTRFPDWVGNPSYHNMTDITLSYCRNCCMLPSLGQLQSLKNLRIAYMDTLVTIDAGFYKNNDSSLLTPFPLLESLEFEGMPCWEVWSPTEPSAFPKLKTLKIENCPKLRGDLPSHLPFLESLILKNMPCWEVWSPIEPDTFPKLKTLEIEDCPKLRGDLPSHLPALEKLSIRSCTELAFSLPRASTIHSLTVVQSNKVVLQELPHSIETLDIEGSPMDCSYTISLFADGCLPESLKYLRISNFRKFEFPKKHIYKSLKSLSINNSCDSLTSLSLETFPNLKDLSIANCEKLESLSASQDCALQNLSSLDIENCPSFVSFPREGLHAPNMTRFFVSHCDKLKSLPQQMNTLLPKLDHLSISNCPEIESFPEGGMPPSLRSLGISNCEILSDPAWPSMDMLTHATIYGPCDGIKSFPKEGLLPSSLTSLRLVNFSSLETLDCKGLLHLTSLQHLIIASCPKLENIAGERLPASLTKLIIFECPLLNELHRRVWDGIRDCYIWGPCDGTKSFPKEGLLPSSLTSLRLYDFSSLETLDCKGLLHLTSLQSLTINKCPKLENIAGERLPASLTQLHINACPLLKERCRQKHLQIWPKISHVHDIKVDWKPIS